MEEQQVRKIDRRVVKTKRAIRNAFAKLLTMKQVDAITIKDIADEADVNRKTIYNYYSGIYEIQGEIENEIVEDFEKVIDHLDFNASHDTAVIFNRLTSVISEDIDFYGHLLDFNVNSQLVRKMMYSLQTIIKNAFIEQHLVPIDKVDTVVNYIGSGMLGAYQGWFNSGRTQPIEEFSKDIANLVNLGMSVYKK